MNKFLHEFIELKTKTGQPTCHDLSFYVIPSMNAVQRSNDQLAKSDLFMAVAADADHDAAIKGMTACYNLQRRTMDRMVRQLTSQADIQVERGDTILFCRGLDDDKEYLGLAANKLKSKYRLPVVCLREADSTAWSGSVRADCDALDMMAGSGYCKAAGHQKAFGVYITKSNFEKFRAWCQEQDWNPQDEIQVAAEIKPEQITLPLCAEIAKYEYLYANDLPAPQFYTKFTVPYGCNPFVGARGATFKYGAFLKFSCKQEDIELLKNGANVEAIVELGVNEYNGAKHPQAKIVQWEIKPLEDKQATHELNWDEIFN